jgi:hypothetical protein
VWFGGLTVPASEENGAVRETLILIGPEAPDVLARIVDLIEGAGGRVSLTWGSNALVAHLDSHALNALRSAPEILVLENGTIPDEIAEALPPRLRDAALLWNQHLARQRRVTPPAGDGLAWDAPGFLAPDLPPELREMLERGEQSEQNSPGE